jgi:hypothetical protein
MTMNLEARPGIEPGYEDHARLPRRHSATGPVAVLGRRVLTGGISLQCARGRRACG